MSKSPKKTPGGMLRPRGFSRKYDDILEQSFSTLASAHFVKQRLATYIRFSLPHKKVIEAVQAEVDLCQRAGLPWGKATDYRIPVELAANFLATDQEALAAIVEDGTLSLTDASLIAVSDDKTARVKAIADTMQIIAERERAEAERKQATAERNKRDEAIKAELLEVLGGVMGPVDVEVLGNLIDSDVLRNVATHPDCGAVSRQVSFGQALSALIGVRNGKDVDNIANRIVSRLIQPVPISVTAKAAHLPMYVVNELVHTTNQTVSHADHDWVVLASQDQQWRTDIVADVRKRREEAETAKRLEDERLAEMANVLGLRSVRSELNTTDAARALDISTASVRAAIMRGDIAARAITGSIGYGKQNFWRIPTEVCVELVTSSNPPAWLVRARQSHEKASARHRLKLEARWASQEQLRRNEQARKQQEQEKRAKARQAVQPHLMRRSIEPETVVFHAGPTNSGKTHDALEALAIAGEGVYAAPLRMLANEAFEALSMRLGESKVGLVTGEERIRDDAPIICCTAEMAPMHGEIIVLDEVHWAADKERGWAWTRLLLGAQYRHIHLAGAPDALPLVRSAFPDVSVVYHERLCPLSVAKQSIPLSDVPERAVVVAFSRKAVHYIARLLKQHGRNPAVLYGAMPPGARRAEISRFVNGDADVVVATDVIGHGINLPVAAVLFAETSKYDGNKRRDLQLWEVAQIAGRAGRYGFETHGTVGSLKGIPGMAAPIKLLAKSERPKVDVGDGLYGYRKVTHGRIAPHLSDLAVTAANELPFHLEAWSDAAVSLAKSVGWVTVASVADIRERLRIIDRSIGLDALDVETAWRLARGPLDPTDDRDVQLFTNFSYAIVGRMDFAALIQRPLEGSLETLESLARQAAGLRWFTLTFPGVGGITHSDVISYEDAVTKAILSALNNTAMTPSVARCPNCGAQRAPWTRLCDTCYQARNDYYYEY